MGPWGQGEENGSGGGMMDREINDELDSSRREGNIADGLRCQTSEELNATSSECLDS